VKLVLKPSALIVALGAVLIALRRKKSTLQPPSPPVAPPPAEEAAGVMPIRIWIVDVVWLVVLAATFLLYKKIDAFADFFPTELGQLPVSVVWFGAVGGLLISFTGIFDHNRTWKRSYDYWHYSRPMLGAIIGPIGCLIFVVLADAANEKPLTPSPTFYDVVAFVLGYREASFRQLITKVIDTIVLPPGAKSPDKTQADIAAQASATTRASTG
jgi:hypothetical protein